MRLHDLTWPRRTERLSLRAATPDDADAIWAYRRLPDVARWLGLSPQSRDELREVQLGEERLGNLLVIELDGQVVGDLMVHVEDGWSQTDVADRAAGTQAEIGWALAPHAQGRGLATEAVREVLAVCFEDLGLRRVVAGCFADNEPTWRLMERVGLRREGHGVAESLHRDLGWVDGYAYALLATEWGGRT